MALHKPNADLLVPAGGVPSLSLGTESSTVLCAEVLSFKGLAEPANVSVERQKGYFNVKGIMSMAVSPDVTYGIITDFENNSKIFKSVSSVEVQHRDDGKVVVQHAHWKFLFWSGQFALKMKVEEDPSNRAISFKLDEPGFLKVFNGNWAIEAVQIQGKPGSKVVVQQQVLPSIVPPGPLADGADEVSGEWWQLVIAMHDVGDGLILCKRLLQAHYVSKIMANQVKDLLEDLLLEATAVQKKSEDTD